MRETIDKRPSVAARFKKIRAVAMLLQAKGNPAPACAAGGVYGR